MKILFITHNVPFPPNKGEKIRSFHIIHELSKRHEIHLVSLVRDQSDLKYKKDLEKFCKSVHLLPLNALISKLYALIALITGYPVTFGYFFSFKAKKLIKELIKTESYEASFAICSSTAQYLYPHKDEFTIIDYVDIDSEKWKRYAEISSFPMSWVYILENQRLGIWEKKICNRFNLSLLTTEKEKEKLSKLAKNCQNKILVCPNGIDTDYFFPEEGTTNSNQSDPSIVFTGQMDYLPNIDAVIYFYVHIFPKILENHKDAKFVIVGRNPDPKLKEICVEAIITGEVDDIRPYLYDGTVFVAPLRLAFGVQNKVLEAMACKLPVVSTSRILPGMKAKIGDDILVADSPTDFANTVCKLLDNKELRDKISVSAHKYVKRNHDWKAVSALIETKLTS